MSSIAIYLTGCGLIAAMIIIGGIVDSRKAGRRPGDDLKAAFDHGHAADMKVLRQCWNQEALQCKAARSVSSV